MPITMSAPLKDQYMALSLCVASQFTVIGAQYDSSLSSSTPSTKFTLFETVTSENEYVNYLGARRGEAITLSTLYTM